MGISNMFLRLLRSFFPNSLRSKTESGAEEKPPSEAKAKEKAVKCGHLTEEKGEVSAFGHTITTQMPRNKSGSIDYCLDCIGKMAIQCAWCRNPIFIGNPITLYTPTNRAFKIPEHAVVYSREPLQLVGCLGWDCADSGADRAGFWLPSTDESANWKGCVFRVPTVYEQILNAKEPTAMIVSDSSDIKEALNPKLIPLEKYKAK